MKEVIINKDNLKEEDINRLVKRAKILIENSNNEILLASSYHNYQFPGGHLEDNETFEEGLYREVLEETGIDIKDTSPSLIMTIEYLVKDYPIEDINTKYIANYYSIKSDAKPKLSLLSLTREEEMGNFKLEYINKKEIVQVLEESLNTCTHKKVVLDTLNVVKEYLKNENK